MDKNEIQNIVTEYLYSREEILTAYIFGSFNSDKGYNDIDIAIYIRDDYILENFQKHPFGYESELLGNLNLMLKTDKIDLLVLNKAGLTISIQVYNSGTLLFEKDRFRRIHIENTIRKEYIDTEHFRKIQSHYLKQRLNVR